MKGVRSGTKKQRAAARHRMLTCNPMKNPATAEKMAVKRRGRPLNRSAKGMANIAAAARKRMLSDANPMKSQATHRAAMAKTLSRKQSKNEIHFFSWTEKNMFDCIKQTGAGTFWIGRRNPDARIIGQRKVLEVTQKECFVGRRKIRTLDGYGQESIRHYLSKGWQCLVVFKKDHRSRIPEALKAVLTDYASPESNWSGVWHFNRLVLFGVSQAILPCITSPAPRKKPTRPTDS